MPDLKSKKETFIFVNASDLEKFVENVYNREYNFAYDNESPNDTAHLFYGIKKKPLDNYDKENLKNFKQRKEYSSITTALLNDLCNQGLIEEGDYLIWVCW